MHALLSASGASRWLNCPPSARLEEDFPDTTNEAAEEGTLAHGLAELITSYKLDIIDENKYKKELEIIKKNPLYEDEMMGHCEDFSIFIMENLSKDSLIYLEEKVDFSRFVPDGFGTCDALIISEDGGLHVIDFKYGRHLVEAENNSQTLLYALGALEAYNDLFDINKVKMTIYQPRRDNISSSIKDSSYIYEWAEKVKDIAHLAYEGGGEFKTGDHCHFCKARHICRLRAEEKLALAQYDFKPPDLLSNEEIGDILLLLGDLNKWSKDVEDYALNKALRGEKFKGFKVVEGRSNRAYTDEEKVEKALRDKRYRIKDIFESKLLTIGKMERFLGKDKFKEILEDDGLVVKPMGKPTLVLETDKREEYNLAEIDFAN